ncbi:MAG: hypothetical protein IPJ65_18280 [Archangiaceae bacterium]|nr:hypothetical protein [Archangiaceae bacterium]
MKRLTRWALAGLLLALPAAATVVIAQNYEQLAQTSPLVVRATVGQVQAAWNEGHTTIETFSELQVSAVLKGKVAPGATLMVRSPGGIVGNVGARVSGSPKFTPGEDTLLFLEPAADAPNVWLVAGLSLGKVTFAKNAFGELRAMRDLRGIAFYDRSPGAPKYQTVDRPEDLGMPEDFLARIRKAVAR